MKMTEANIIIDEGLRDPMSFSTKSKGRINISYRELFGKITYKTRIVGMARKMSGFFFMRFRIAQDRATILVSELLFGQILRDLKNEDPTFERKFNEMFKTFDFNNDVPKDVLFVKLKKDISKSRKAFISNGIRSFFRND